MPETLRLFPLEIVLFPGMPLPLHIFEPRYKQMIGECIAGDLPFGVILENEGERAEVGCSAAIVQQIQSYPDGRLDILVEGRRRFKLLSIDDEEHAWLSAQIEWLDDSPEDLQKSRSEVLDLYRRTYWAHAHGLTPEAVATAPTMSFAIARSGLMDIISRQRLLETDGESARLSVLAQALRELEPIAKKLGGNGHAPRG